MKHERNTNLRNVFVTSFAVIETVSVFRRKQMARAHAYGGMEGARDLITYLAENEVASVRDFARQLNRDKGQVSRDLETLTCHSGVRVGVALDIE